MANATQSPVEENESQETVNKEDQDMEDLFNGEGKLVCLGVTSHCCGLFLGRLLCLDT